MAGGYAARTLKNGQVTRITVPQRDKAELRGAMQDAVREYTFLRRERLLPVLRRDHPEASEAELLVLLDEAQPLYDEFDPVVQLAIIGADHSNSPELRRAALAESAQYVRPKLKSIELTVDPASAEAMDERRALADRLVGLLEAGAGAKRATVIEGESRPAKDEVQG